MKLVCLSPTELHSFLEGNVSDAKSRQISEHLDHCNCCDAMCRRLESGAVDFENQLRQEWVASKLLEEPELNLLRKAAIKASVSNEKTADLKESKLRRLRDYRLVKKIGEGGMGTVYQAVHLRLGKVVALKILPEDKLHSSSAVSRFQQEMRAVGKLSHPNVVSASDAGDEDGRQFLVMELVEGADLARVMKEQGVIGVADACEIVRQTALGLEHAHQNGLVHRDVKPSNIMLSVRGEVKLLDLGLAGLNCMDPTNDTAVDDDRLTSVGQIIGTLDYMAPEHAIASTDIDHKADLYTLGATLFTLITGKTPCGNRGDNTIKRVESLLNDSPRELTEFAPDAPPELNELVKRLLSKSPDARPKSAGEVAHQLEQFAVEANLTELAESCRTSLDIPSADVDITEDISMLVAFSPAVPIAKPELTKAGPRNWMNWTVGSATVALIFGLLAMLLFLGVQTSHESNLNEKQEGKVIVPAEVVFKQGGWQRASEVAEQEVKLHPESGWLHAKAAMMWAYQMGHIDVEKRRSYLHHCRWLTERWKKTGEGANTIPRVCCVYPDGTDERAAMLKAVLAEEKRHPNDWRLPHSAMMLHCRLGQYDLALEAFERCRQISPTNDMHAALDHTWRALALFRLKRGDNAWEVQKQAMTHFMKLKPSTDNKIPAMWFDYIELMVVMCEVSIICSEYPFDEPSTETENDQVAASLPPTSNHEEIELAAWREVGEKIMHADISDDGKQIALAVGWRPGKWEWITNGGPTSKEGNASIKDEDVVRHTGGQPVRSVGIHPSGKIVALGRWYGAVDIVDVERNEIIITHETSIGKLRKANDVVFDETGDILFIGYQSNRIVAWNWKEDEVLAQKTYAKPVWSVPVRDDNKIRIHGSVWNWKTGETTSIVEPSEGAIWLTPDGMLAITLSGKTLTVHSIGDHRSKPIYDIELEQTVSCMNSIGNMLFIGHENGELSLLDFDSRKIATIGRLMAGTKVRRIYITQNRKVVLATTGDKVPNGRIAIWRCGDIKDLLRRNGTPVEPRLRHHSAPALIKEYEYLEDVQKQLLRMLQGNWKHGDQMLEIRRNEWVWANARKSEVDEIEPGAIEIVGSRAGLIEAKLHVAVGTNAGRTVYALFQPIGDTLLYCGSYDSRPDNIYDTRKGMYFFQWQRLDSKRHKK